MHLLFFAVLPKVIWWFHATRGGLLSLGLGGQLSGEGSSGPPPRCRLQQGLLVVLGRAAGQLAQAGGRSRRARPPVSSPWALTAASGR